MPPPEKKEEPAKKVEEEKKKPKVETRDAQTQTDRSDYQLIKQKMMRERRLKEEQAQKQQQKQQQAKTAGETQMLKELKNNRPSESVSKQQNLQMNT